MQFSLSQRFFLWAFALSLIAVTTVSLWYDRKAEAAIVQRTFDQLASVRALKKSKVKDYLHSVRTMLSVVAAHPATILTAAREMQTKYGIQDVYVVAPTGEILSTFQNSSSGTNSLPARVSATFQAIQRQTTLAQQQKIYFTDIVREQGTQDICAFGIVRIDSLAAASVADDAGQTVAKADIPLREGNFIFAKISAHTINQIMFDNDGFGATGESYLVGEDSLMRTESRFFAEASTLQRPVRTEPLRRAFANETGFAVALDYRNVEVLSAFTVISVEQARWALLVELDVAEITSPINETRREIAFLGLSITIVLAALSWYGARRFSRPIVQLQGQLSALAQEGHLPEQPLVMRRSDEIGAMVQELNRMISSLRQASYFAKDIGAGRFDTVFTPRSPHDVLVIALNDMKREFQKLLAERQTQALQRTRALVEGEERERLRISRDVHDGVGQILSALRFNLKRIPDEQIRSEAIDLADDAISEVRAISHNLMPAVLVDFGIVAALEQLCRKISERTHVRIERDILTLAELPERLESAKEIALYRIAQEALNNALRYADATMIRLVFRLKLRESHNEDFHEDFHEDSQKNSQEDSQKDSHNEATKHEEHSPQSVVLLRVQDNGKGFDIAQTVDGNGIVNMRERAALFGATLRLRSAIGTGTCIELEMPIALSKDTMHDVM